MLMKSKFIWIIAGILICDLLLLAGIAARTYLGGRNSKVFAFLSDPATHADWQTQALTKCAGAPFSFPTTGYIGYLWGDSFKLFQRHQGIDIFGGSAPGLTPVYAPYDGFLTRETSWKSSLIIRVPSDPLQPDRPIWLYMTHLADQDGLSLIADRFPAGTREVAVKAGDFLGYQGNYSGDRNNPVGVHLHFSIVLDDGSGHYLNELKIANTLDPSPYFGLPLNADTASDSTPICPSPSAH